MIRKILLWLFPYRPNEVSVYVYLDSGMGWMVDCHISYQVGPFDDFIQAWKYCRAVKRIRKLR